MATTQNKTKNAGGKTAQSKACSAKSGSKCSAKATAKSASSKKTVSARNSK